MLVALFALALSAHAQDACTPQYELTYANCKQTGEVLRFETQTVKSVTVTPGACEVPDAMALCNQHDKSQIAKLFPGATPDRVRPKNPRTPTAEGKFCGSITKLRSKVDVVCDFEVDVPVYAMKSDSSCPVIDVLDSNECLKKDPVVLSVEASRECLALNPKGVTDFWLKAACLADLYQASQSFTTKGISSETADEVERQLKIAKKRAANGGELDYVNSYLQNRKLK